jgi:hypothetical protein
MGTRSLTVVAESDGGAENVVMYRQMDGYPEGHGKELVKAFGDYQICNGYGSEQNVGKWANGMSCLAAQVVAHFKDGIGGFYLHPSGVRGYDEEYIYYLYPRSREFAFNPPSPARRNEITLCLRVLSVGMDENEVLYDGSIENAKEWLGV